MEPLELVGRLAAASIGGTFNQYAGSPRLRERLRAYLAARADAGVVLVGEAAGYRGARISGIPFTSERQLSGSGPAEATATIVHRVLAALGLEDEVLLWNVVPTHPGTAASNRRPTRAEVAAAAPFLREITAGRAPIAVGRLAAAELGLEERVLLWNVVPTHPGSETSNRRPSRAEIEAGLPFARRLARGRQVVAVGRVAEAALAAAYVRHPSHGGVETFRSGLEAVTVRAG